VGAQVAEPGELAQVQVQVQVQELSPTGRVACAERLVGWRAPLKAVLGLLRQAVPDLLHGVLDLPQAVLDPLKQAVPGLLQAAPEPRRPSRTAPQ